MNSFTFRLATLAAACTLLNGCRGSNANVPPVPTPAAAAPAPPASAVVPGAKADVGPGAGPAGQVMPTPQPAASAAAPQGAPQPAAASSGQASTDDPVTAAPPGLVSGPAALKAVPCSVLDVSLKPGKSDGSFDGMSHSGTYLILTNHSHTACSIPGLPRVTFTDANGPVTTVADLPGAKFMHPGPVVLPILLQPKQSVYASVRWVDGPVFSDNLCYKLTGVGVAMTHDGDTVMPLAGQMCGERSKGVHYDLQRYAAGLPLSQSK